jgi:hypothetical protein
VEQFEGWILIENTYFETTSLFSMASKIAIGNHASNGGNFVRAYR